MKTTMENLNAQYKDLKTNVMSTLRDRINNSDTHSEHVDSKCIKVNVFDYTEMVILNGDILFLDDRGYHYHLYNGDCSLEDFIDILNKL